MASAGESDPSDIYENVTTFSRLSRSNCIKKTTNSLNILHSSLVLGSPRSHSLGGLPRKSPKANRRDNKHEDSAHFDGEEFDSSSESLYDDDDLEEGLQPEVEEVPERGTIENRKQKSRLWAHIPEVITSGVIATLTDAQKYQQEAKYEILTSEEAYNWNLHVLEDLFINGVHFVDDGILSKIARENVFKNIKAITDSSDEFLVDLYAAWETSLFLTDIFDVLLKHAAHNFQSYIKYCTKKKDMEDVLKKIQKYYNQVKDRPEFKRQTLDSFFLSPMQRITRLPLLVSNVLSRMAKTDEQYELCKKSNSALMEVASSCNENVRHKELMETTIGLISKIEFPRSIASIALISKSRWLVRHDEFVLHWSSSNKSATLKLTAKKSVSLILFNDLILICRKKNDHFFVEGYCKVNLTKITRTQDVGYIPSKYKTDKEGRYWVSLSFLSNHEKKTQEMILSCDTDAKRSEWIESFEPPISDVLGEIIYHPWDCPLFLVIRDYASSKTGHLNIKLADKIHVTRKTTNGFYEGQKERDGQKGLFPKECVTEIDSEHKRARDLRMKMNRMSLAS